MRQVLTYNEAIKYLEEFDRKLYKVVEVDWIEGNMVEVSLKELLEFNEFERNYFLLVSQDLDGNNWMKRFTDTEKSYSIIIDQLERKIRTLEKKDNIKIKNFNIINDQNQEFLNMENDIAKALQDSIPEKIKEHFRKIYNDSILNEPNKKLQMYFHSFEVFEKGNPVHDIIAKESLKRHFCTGYEENETHYAQWSFGD